MIAAVVDDESKPASGGGSRARDHMANERTYLAWLRTAVNVMVLGLAIAKFGSKDQAASIAAGGIVVVVGAAFLAYGTRRYRQVNVQIEAGEYLTGTHGNAAVVASVVLVLATFAALLLLVTAGN
jgi:putative membrane protein